MKPKKLLGVALSLLFCTQAIGADKAMASQRVLRTPTHLHAPAPRRPITFTPDILLVMPNPRDNSEDLQKALEETHGTVIGSMGEGRLKCLIVKTEKNKLVETETKMKKDKKDFFCVGRDYRVPAEGGGSTSGGTQDPDYTSEWYVTALNCQKAWTKSTGSGVTIGILDTGCQSTNPDLANKTQKGFDATSFWAHMMGLSGIPDGAATIAGGIGLGLAEATNGGAQTDVMGHGTEVATTAAATGNNQVDGVGVAPNATIYPIRIANGQGMTDPIAIQAAILQAMLKGIKIINISYGFQPPFGLTDPALYPTMHAYMAFFHDVYGGIIFMSAGNDSSFDATPNLGYVNIVSAIEPNLELTSFSNYGNCITYTAPGDGIICSARDNSRANVRGTSFSSPMLAGVAALVWSANPGLSNTQVEGILTSSCAGTILADQSQYYGHGMPDANIAVNLALGNFPNQ